jgi:hypothetical protein
MLLQILIHTPLYVWPVLALLIYRGVSARKDHEMAFGRILIIPLVIAPLTLTDLVVKFGPGVATFACWSAAAAITALLTFTFSAPRIAVGSQPGKVLVRGSWILLSLLMAIFFTKYAAAVMLAVAPQLRHSPGFIMLACGAYGLFNGVFLGRMARDVGAYQQIRVRIPAGDAQAA